MHQHPQEVALSCIAALGLCALEDQEEVGSAFCRRSQACLARMLREREYCFKRSETKAHKLRKAVQKDIVLESKMNAENLPAC
jgi:hypothetical protein